jgi:hypothetical protein
VLIVIAIAIAALVSAGRAIFGGGDQAAQTQIDVGRDALLNTSLNRSVRMTVRGPIVADENFRSYQVTVNPADRSLTTYSGYLAEPLDTKQFGNNVKAYDEFVHALDKANLMKGEALKDEKDDTRGICATGNVYEFEVLNGGGTVKRLWTSTCKGSTGSLKASVAQLETLFHNQIPDSRAVLRTIDL